MPWVSHIFINALLFPTTNLHKTPTVGEFFGQSIRSQPVQMKANDSYCLFSKATQNVSHLEEVALDKFEVYLTQNRS